MPLSLEYRVYNATERDVILYASGTWPLRADDLRRLWAFDNRFPLSIPRVIWRHRVSNVELIERVFGSGNTFCSPEHQISLHCLHCFDHVLRMPTD